MNLKKYLTLIANTLGLERQLLRAVQSLKFKAPYKRQDISEQKIFGKFITEDGLKLPLYKGFRSRIKPNWQSMLNNDDNNATSERINRTRLNEWRIRIEEPLNLLFNLSFQLAGKTVLEIGANDGATAFSIAEKGAGKVIATDIANYYINQKNPDSSNENAAIKVNKALEQKRNSYRVLVTKEVFQKVHFEEDDICNTNIAPESADLLISWEVIEHLENPEQGFLNMYNSLRPGGFAFHEYNPFFALDGGHSLCTLDFPWGHARLSARDFERYIETYRPQEKSVALSFYIKCLNRLSLYDVANLSEQVGFLSPIVVPWPQRSHLIKVDESIVQQVKKHYSRVTVMDLISPRVWVILRKPF